MTIVCPENEITEKSAKGYDVDGQAVVITRKDGQLYVYVNSCPHLGIPLEFQPNEFLDMEKRFIQCANHGALFEIETGDCIAGPCTGQTLKSLPFQIENGNIILP